MIAERLHLLLNPAGPGAGLELWGQSLGSDPWRVSWCCAEPLSSLGCCCWLLCARSLWTLLLERALELLMHTRSLQSQAGALWCFYTKFHCRDEPQLSTRCSPQRNSPLVGRFNCLSVHFTKPFSEEPCIMFCSQILLASSLGSGEGGPGGRSLTGFRCSCCGW